MVKLSTSFAATALLSVRFAYAMPTMMPVDSESMMMDGEISMSESSPLAMVYESPAMAPETPAPMADEMPAMAEIESSMAMAEPAMETSMYMAEPVMETSMYMAEPAMETTTAAAEYAAPSHGSGSMSSEFEDCVAQCSASFPAAAAPTAAPATYESSAPTPTEAGAADGGSGVTHTVIVAPSQGVLRYVPFAVNASIGDTVSFQWGANVHTVTKSSALQPCNKSADPIFAPSGVQNKTFVFNQVVNDTEPLFFYCAVGVHCQSGMFGIINPPNAAGAPASAAMMMPELSASDPKMAAMASYTAQKTSGNTAAASWGNTIDMSAVPEWAQAPMAENIMYTKTFLAANPEIMKDGGAVDMSGMGDTPVMVPEDITVAALNNAAVGPATAASATPVAPAAASPSVSADAAEVTPGGNLSSTSGAASISAAPGVLVALVALALTSFIAL